MHTLTRIVMRMPAEYLYADLATRQRICRNIADENLESYEDVVWDYHSLADAGCYSDRYPVNAMFARENIEKFINELKECKRHQDAEIKSCTDYFGLDASLRSIIASCQSSDRNAYEFQTLAEFVCGQFTCISGFYCVDDMTARITDELMERIRRYPTEWAMVLIDCHF